MLKAKRKPILKLITTITFKQIKACSYSCFYIVVGGGEGAGGREPGRIEGGRGTGGGRGKGGKRSSKGAGSGRKMRNAIFSSSTMR